MRPQPRPARLTRLTILEEQGGRIETSIAALGRATVATRTILTAPASPTAAVRRAGGCLGSSR